MKWKMQISKRVIELISLIYIYISLLIFLWGWCRPLAALVSTAVIFYAVYMLDKENRENNEIIIIDIRAFIFTAIFLLAIGYYAGYGRFTLQTYDWMKHNAIFYDLSNKSWPVYYHNGDEDSMLTYYLGQYMVPGLVGKIVHSGRVAEKVNLIWAVLGLILVDLNVLKVLRIKKTGIQAVTPVLLTFFSCPLVLAQIIQAALNNGGTSFGDFEWFLYAGELKLQYSSNYILITWAFPQAIVMWITVTLWIEHKDKIKHYVAILLPAMFYGILSFLGVIPLALVMAVYTIIKKKNLKASLKNLFSISNILMTATVGFVLLAYYYGNVTGEKPGDIGFKLVDYSGGNIKQYFIFVIVMIGIYTVCLWKNNRKNVIFISSLTELVILPLFTMGLYNDWLLRVSIPALFVFFMLILSFFNDLSEGKIEIKKNGWQAALLVVMLTFGSVYPLRQLGIIFAYDNVFYVESQLEWSTLENFANRADESLGDDIKYNYYSYDIEDNFFYKYLSRKQIDSDAN